jgi:hypothetical protein
MKSSIVAKSFEQPVVSFSFSDISELTLGVTGLRVVVSFDRTHDDEDRYLEVLFSVPEDLDSSMREICSLTGG